MDSVQLQLQYLTFSDHFSGQKTEDLLLIPGNKSYLKTIYPAIWLFLLISLTYLQVLGFGFSPLDDNSLFLDQMPWFQDMGNLLSIFTSPLAGFYRPMLFITFMVDSITGSGSPFTFHLTNLLLHYSSVLLFFYFLQNIGISRKNSFFSALLFAVYPIHIQAISWIPGRNDILLAIFVFSTVILFLKYLKSSSIQMFWTYNSFYLLSLLTKENAIVLPVLLLLFIWLFKKEDFNRNKIFLPVVVWILITIPWILLRTFMVGETTFMDLTDLSGSFLQFVGAMVINVGKQVIPASQSILSTVTGSQIGLYATLIIGFILFIWVNGIGKKNLFYFGLLWMIAFLIIPTAWSSIDTLGEYYEHRLYVPLCGMIIIYNSLDLNPFFRRVFNRFSLSIFVVIILLFFFIDSKRSTLYNKKFTFAETALRESPLHFRSYKIMGTVLSELGLYEESLPYFDSALQMRPNDPELYYNHGLTLYYLDRFDEAINDFNQAILIKPDYLDAYNNRGIAYSHIGKTEMAILDFKTVLNSEPFSYITINNLGLSYYELKNHDMAINLFTHAITINPTFKFAYNNRGQVYLHESKYDKALNDFSAASSIDTMYFSPKVGKAIVYLKTDQPEKLEKEINILEKISPGFSLEDYLPIIQE